VAITEFHPSLYNGATPKVQPGGTIDGYWLMLAWLRAFKLGVTHLIWYSLFDYGTTYLSGLFVKTGGVAPRSAAYVVRNLCTICRDNGATANTFSPGKLNYTLSGMPAGAWDSLFQDSAGHFYLQLANPSVTMGGVPTPVTVSVTPTPASMVEYDLSKGVGGTTPIQSVASVGSLTSQLNGSVRTIVVTP